MELKFRYRFEAAHRFTKATSASCMTPHGHTWHATLHLESLRSLNQDGMIVEFSKAKSFWKTLISDVFDHSYMCHHQDPLFESLLGIHNQARVLRFPNDPTTEMIALLLFHKAQLVLANENLDRDIRVSGITIEETPTNSLFCERKFYVENIQLYKNFSGWWTTVDPLDRSFKHDISATN
jgi:6-pyruvoyl-tetrahydropterin synthase